MKAKIEEVTRVEVKRIETKEKVLNAELSAKEVALLKLVLGKVSGEGPNSLAEIAEKLYYGFYDISLNNDMTTSIPTCYKSFNEIRFNKDTLNLLNDVRFS
jgi:hypothetical protein